MPILEQKQCIRVQNDVIKRVVPHGRGDAEGVEGQAARVVCMRVTRGDVRFAVEKTGLLKKIALTAAARGIGWRHSGATWPVASSW